jgi:hypothetical protein
VNEVDHPRINKCPKKRKERRHMLHMPLESERGGGGREREKSIKTKESCTVQRRTHTVYKCTWYSTSCVLKS